SATGAIGASRPEMPRYHDQCPTVDYVPEHSEGHIPHMHWRKRPLAKYQSTRASTMVHPGSSDDRVVAEFPENALRTYLWGMDCQPVGAAWPSRAGSRKAIRLAREMDHRYMLSAHFLVFDPRGSDSIRHDPLTSARKEG